MEKQKWSSLGLWFVFIYIGLFLLSAIFTIYYITDSALSSLYSTILTLPWSLMSVFLLNPYINWYDHFVDTHQYLLYGMFAELGLLPGLLINSIIFYYIGKSTGK